MNKIDIKLNPGEIVCDKCHGIGNYGYTRPNGNMRSYPKICSKCRGRGKLDWIENIVGKLPLSNPHQTFLYPVIDEILNESAKDLAIQIDKEILESMVKTMNYKFK